MGATTRVITTQGTYYKFLFFKIIVNMFNLLFNINVMLNISYSGVVFVSFA